MDNHSEQIALDIIKRSDKDHPADSVMRQALRAVGGLSRPEAREASHAVFAYYRWFGWLESSRSVQANLHHAVEMAKAYRERPQTFSDETLLARSLPAWTPEEMEVTPAWVRAIQGAPHLWLRTKHGLASQLAEKLGHTSAAPFPDALLYEGEEDLFLRPEFQAGEFEIQDLASHAVGLLCHPRPGQTWWDTCTGGGGKMLHLSDQMLNKGLIWASDRAKWRLKRLRIRAARAKCFNYRIVPWEGGARLPVETRFDGVLVDAPCSGVGTWQKNPHARWTTTPQDVLELAAVQKELLTHTAPSLKPGGRLIYAVCTLTRRETIEVADHMDRILVGFEPCPLPDLLHPEAPPMPRRWIWPQELGSNGMFVAAWKRKEEAPAAVEIAPAA